jgi:hypothetical protein
MLSAMLRPLIRLLAALSVAAMAFTGLWSCVDGTTPNCAGDAGCGPGVDGAVPEASTDGGTDASTDESTGDVTDAGSDLGSDTGSDTGAADAPGESSKG